MQEQPSGNWGSQYGPYLTVGLQLAITVVVFFFLGRWLDDTFQTAPWLMIAGLMLGIVGGLISFFRTAITLGRKQDEEAARRRAKHED